MVFGYSTNAFVKYDLFTAVEKIADLGFGGVEIMADRPHLYPADFNPDQLARLKKSIDQRGLKITNLNSFTLFAVGDMYLPSWIETEPARRQIRVEHTLECLRLAARLGAENISVPPGGPLEEKLSRKEMMSLFLHELEKVVPLAEELKVKLLVEPEPNLLMENSRQFRDFMHDIRSPAVGLNFDVGHFFCAREDPCATFQELFGWIGHVHLEDIAATRVHHHLIPGLGAIEFAAFLRTVLRMNYGGHISLELYPYVEMPEEAGRKSLAYLLPVFEEVGIKIK